MYSSTLPSTSALDGGVGGQRHARAALAPGKAPVPIVQNAGWAPGPVCTSAENLAPIWIRSPDRPARNESLYRLSYPGRIHEYRPIHNSYSHTHEFAIQNDNDTFFELPAVLELYCIMSTRDIKHSVSVKIQSFIFSKEVSITWKHRSTTCNLNTAILSQLPAYKALRHKPEGHRFDSRWCHLDLSLT